MTALFTDLQTIGLTENQATIYLALARLRLAKAGELIKKTGFHRNIVYTALDELLEKKLITTTVVRGVRIYKMLAPERLRSSLKEKELAAEQAIEELKLYQKKKSAQEVITYEGIEEFRSHSLRSFEVSKQGTLIRYLGTSPRWHRLVDKETEEKLIRIQKEKKLKVRGIAKAPFPEIRDWLTAAKESTELRYNQFIGSDTNNIEILEDRICIQSFVEPYLVVEIINKEVARNYQAYFDFLWSKSKN